MRQLLFLACICLGHDAVNSFGLFPTPLGVGQRMQQQQQNLMCQRSRSSNHLSLTSPLQLAKSEEEEKKRKPFPFGRFFKTFAFFNAPKRPSIRRTFQRIRGKGQGAAPVPVGEGCPRELSGGVVLVTGATGGVGRRVVDLLLRRGVRVRALVRNKDKGLAMLGRVPDDEDKEKELQSRLEQVVADIKDASSLRPSYFNDVIAVVSCTSAIVQPKEGDGPDRAKYFQGIKFYEPENVDVPEQVESVGMKNLLQALKSADLQGKVLFSSLPVQQDRWRAWGALDDVVMGGVSESNLRLVPGASEVGTGAAMAAVFAGTVETANSGGFVSVRCKNYEPPLDLSAYAGIRLRVKGDGNRYKFIVYDTPQWSALSWCHSFDTLKGEWQDIDIPWSAFRPIFRAKSVPDAKPMSISTISSMQLMLSKFEYDGDLNPNFTAGPFSLTVESIKAMLPKGDEALPRVVHISSAGVTRPGKPGLKIEEEPPAVRMNDMLNGLLDYKLEGEDAIRASGLPATIIRPCALTEEPRGAPMILKQGDEIKGKISRDDIAELATAALTTPEAAGKTFEVKSDLAFSDIYPGSDTKRDYKAMFGALQKGITGAEWKKKA